MTERKIKFVANPYFIDIEDVISKHDIDELYILYPKNEEIMKYLFDRQIDRRTLRQIKYYVGIIKLTDLKEHQIIGYNIGMVDRISMKRDFGIDILGEKCFFTKIVEFTDDVIKIYYKMHTTITAIFGSKLFAKKYGLPDHDISPLILGNDKFTDMNMLIPALSIDNISSFLTNKEIHYLFVKIIQAGLIQDIFTTSIIENLSKIISGQNVENIRAMLIDALNKSERFFVNMTVLDSFPKDFIRSYNRYFDLPYHPIYGQLVTQLMSDALTRDNTIYFREIEFSIRKRTTMEFITELNYILGLEGLVLRDFLLRRINAKISTKIKDEIMKDHQDHLNFKRKELIEVVANKNLCDTLAGMFAENKVTSWDKYEGEDELLNRYYSCFGNGDIVSIKMDETVEEPVFSECVTAIVTVQDIVIEISNFIEDNNYDFVVVPHNYRTKEKVMISSTVISHLLNR